MSNINIWMTGGGLEPVKADKLRGWWENDRKMVGHAKFCLPLTMASGLGYWILSPATFWVRWDGKGDSDAEVEITEGLEGTVVDAHSACGSFTVQPGFIATTEKEGDFLYVRGVANQERRGFYFLDALIEAWWSVANFGLVGMCSGVGSFRINKGEPIAQMFIVNQDSLGTDLVVREGAPEGWDAWNERRSRPGYKRDLDYLQGRDALGNEEKLHFKGCPGKVVRK